MQTTEALINAPVHINPNDIYIDPASDEYEPEEGEVREETYFKRMFRNRDGIEFPMYVKLLVVKYDSGVDVYVYRYYKREWWPYEHGGTLIVNTENGWTIDFNKCNTPFKYMFNNYNPRLSILFDKLGYVDEEVPPTENKLTITESEVDNVVKTVLNEYLDKNFMNPLYKYLKRYGKKYDQDEFARRYYQYTNYLKGYPLTTAHAFQEPEVFKNGWVVHFTNNPYQILKNGFKGVRSEYLKSLWRTYGRGYEQTEDGYCFAYDANDNIPQNAIEYGEYGLVFRVSGLKVKNLGDLGEKQVVFNSKMANLKECYIIVPECDTRSDYDGNGDIETIKTLTGISVINPVTKKKLYVSKTIGGALQWIQTNYRQYSSANVSKIIPSLKKADKQNEQTVNGLIEYVKSWAKDLVIWDDNDVRYQTVHLIYTGSLNNYMEQLYKLADMRKKYENDYIEINLKYMRDPVFYYSAMRWTKEHGIQESNPMKLYQMAEEYNIHEIIITRNK